ncbi:MAG: aldehyde dehydrogenase family protein, partial [Parasporobacterium sp.]|nr:aldehyde dehydrogenase family protein [Parasporobacterium sp.]
MNIAELKAKQKAYFLSGTTRSVEFRKNALAKLKNAIIQNEKLLNDAVMQDLHRHSTENYMCELGIVLNEISYHQKHLSSWMRDKHVPAIIGQMPASCYISPEPYGVVLIMAAWNYPIQLNLSPLVGAISAGNCAIIKPSAYASATSNAIAKIIGETFSPEYIAVVEGGRKENSTLLQEEFDYIFFTGSV